MKKVELEAMIACVILEFCENLGELGCPMTEAPDMWFRNLSERQQIEVGSKLLDIMGSEGVSEIKKSKKSTKKKNVKKL